MTGWYVVSGVLGVAIGLWFRVYAVLAATVVVGATVVGESLRAGHSVEAVLIRAVVAIVCLQSGYIAGLLISTGWRRRSQRPTRR